MSKCPYTWFTGLFKIKENSSSAQEAKHLNVCVLKNGQETVRVQLPAQSARWLIELIPFDVIAKINEEKIPLEAMIKELEKQNPLTPGHIFQLDEPDRQVTVWLD